MTASLRFRRSPAALPSLVAGTARLIACVVGVGVGTLGAGCGDHHPRPPLSDASTNVEISDGSVRINAGFNDCPAVGLSASPAVTRVGDPVTVSARAHDDDATDRLTYAWTATAGAFASPTATETVYRCPGMAQAGPQTITVSVSDGQCTVAQSAVIDCYGFADAGSSPAPGADGGGGDATTGGAGGTGGSGGSSGSGGSGGAGGSTGAGGAASVCEGDRTTCEGTLCNQCSFGVKAGQTDLCSQTNETCENCIAGKEGCDGLSSDAMRTKCEDLYLCIRDAKCVQDGDAIRCWCGTVDTDKCQSGTIPANGPCVRQVIDAAGSSDPTVINLRFIDYNFALGGAVNLATCRSNFCGKQVDPVTPSCPLW